MVVGVDYVSSIIAKYASVEQHYIHTSPLTPSTTQLRGAIIRLYAATLVYLSKASKHYNQSTGGKLFSCPSLAASTNQSLSTLPQKCEQARRAYYRGLSKNARSRRRQGQ